VTYKKTSRNKTRPKMALEMVNGIPRDNRRKTVKGWEVTALVPNPNRINKMKKTIA
jgi:hypothetical protein